MVPKGFDAMPNLADQTDFTIDLFEHWDVHASVGAGGMERLLRLPTWCLHGDRLRMNDEIRSIYFGDDFYEWERDIRRAWQDLLDPGMEVEFTIVWDPPGSEYNTALVHIIVFQVPRPGDCANLVTTYDDTVMNNRPYTTAVFVPSFVDQSAILHAVHRTQDCPPFNPHTQCTTWHGGWQFHDYRPYQGRHGYAYMLIIQFAVPMTIDDEMRHPEAASSTSFLQIRAETRRLTTGQVAHTQWPGPQQISLEETIPPPVQVSVDFTPVQHIADELRNLAHLFGQPWPISLEIPSVTSLALQQLLPLDDRVPFGFHFYTDGSKMPNSSVGSAVVLILKTVDGFHYGGCHYSSVVTENTSNAGEDAAIIWALLWATLGNPFEQH